MGLMVVSNLLFMLGMISYRWDQHARLAEIRKLEAEIKALQVEVGKLQVSPAASPEK